MDVLMPQPLTPNGYLTGLILAQQYIYTINKPLRNTYLSRQDGHKYNKNTKN